MTHDMIVFIAGFACALGGVFAGVAICTLNWAKKVTAIAGSIASTYQRATQSQTAFVQPNPFHRSNLPPIEPKTHQNTLKDRPGAR